MQNHLRRPLTNNYVGIVFPRYGILSENNNLFPFYFSAEGEKYDKAMVEFAMMWIRTKPLFKGCASTINHVSLHHSPGYIWLQVTDLEIETQNQNLLTF